MIADALLRQTAQRVIERLDPDHREFLVVVDIGLGVDHVPAGRGRRIVELEDKPGIEDGLVFLAHRLGPGVKELLVAVVIGVGNPVGAAGRDGGHETFRSPRCLQRRFEIVDVGLERILAGVSERTNADRPGGGPGTHEHAGLAVGIGGGKPHPIAPTSGVVQHDLAGAGGSRGHMVEARPAEFESAEAQKRVVPPRAIVDAMPHRLAELAVARDVDTELLLMTHDVVDRCSQCFSNCLLIGRLAGLARVVRGD